MKALLWLLGAVVMAGVIFWLFPRSRPPVAPEVRFLGYIQGPFGEPMVCLGVKNLNSFPIVSSHYTYVQNPSVAAVRTVFTTRVTVPPNEEATLPLPSLVTTNSYQVNLGYERYESSVVRQMKALLHAVGFQTSATLYTVAGPMIEP